jgi:hypothetical protein
MKRQELEHIVRAAAGITGERNSSSLAASPFWENIRMRPARSGTRWKSIIYPKDHPELAELISGCLGEYSPFHNTFNYYADGVAPDTSMLPAGWENRLVRFANENTNGAVAHCLDPLDLAYAKLAAGRPKDLDYVVELTRYHFIQPSALTRLVEQVEDPALKAAMTERWQVVQAKKLALEKPPSGRQA